MDTVLRSEMSPTITKAAAPSSPCHQSASSPDHPIPATAHTKHPSGAPMPGIEHHRRALERRLADLESLLAGAEREARREEGEIVGRAVVAGRWARRAGRAAAHARRVLAGFRREAALRDARAGEPLARRVRRHFTRDSPLLLRLKLCWELERALCRMDELLGGDDEDEHGSLEIIPGAGRDEAVVRELLDDKHSFRVLLIAGTTTTAAAAGGCPAGKSSLAAAVVGDARVRSHFEEVAWRRAPRELEAAAVLRSVLASDMFRERDGAAATKVSPAAAAAGRRKRFLLVVDGSWSDEEERRSWEDVMVPRLRSGASRNAPGSMVVVTTATMFL